MNPEIDARETLKKLIGKNVWGARASVMGLSLEIGKMSGWGAQVNQMRGELSLFAQCNWRVTEKFSVLFEDFDEINEDWSGRLAANLMNYVINTVEIESLGNGLVVSDGRGKEIKFQILEPDDSWTLFYWKDGKASWFSFYADRIACDD